MDFNVVNFYFIDKKLIFLNIFVFHRWSQFKQVLNMIVKILFHMYNLPMYNLSMYNLDWRLKVWELCPLWMAKARPRGHKATNHVSFCVMFSINRPVCKTLEHIWKFLCRKLYIFHILLKIQRLVDPDKNLSSHL